ncbi:hypothetical protein EAS61_11405 [Bradyrhizobium zhanjiangense]|uniref:Uncharacterized protein n=1 Tax=Bradyrhizobium zhanjiangense TaxID=1325107 RepID=A0A4Q0QUA1_9BRAD|nr:hypothetical protein EAS61_11405 [Bradyrhizobium zhanjiangense]
MERRYRLNLNCHSPRRRGIQYAAASRFNHDRLGVLDRPVPAPPRLRRGHKGAWPPKLQRRRQAGR